MAQAGTEPRVNTRIKAPQVRVVDPNGKHLGVMPIAQALATARSYGLDLVEVSPNADPPVCKILDYGKYMYEQAKREKEARKHQAAQRVKEIQLSVNIGNHDFATKLRHAIEFLCDDMKVKLTLRFQGREMEHTEFGFDVMRRFLKELAPFGQADFEPKLNGRVIHTVVTPLPRQKRAKNPFATESAPSNAQNSNKISNTAATNPAVNPKNPTALNNPFEDLSMSGQA